jgi:hypothetical protein
MCENHLIWEPGWFLKILKIWYPDWLSYVLKSFFLKNKVSSLKCWEERKLMFLIKEKKKERTTQHWYIPFTPGSRLQKGRTSLKTTSTSPQVHGTFLNPKRRDPLSWMNMQKKEKNSATQSSSGQFPSSYILKWWLQTHFGTPKHIINALTLDSLSYEQTFQYMDNTSRVNMQQELQLSWWGTKLARQAWHPLSQMMDNQLVYYLSCGGESAQRFSFFLIFFFNFVIWKKKFWNLSKSLTKSSQVLH